MELKVLLLLSIFAICESVTIDSLIECIDRCKWKSKDMNQCIKNNIENIKSLVGKGIQALYVPPMEDLEYDNLMFKNDQVQGTGNNFHVRDLKFFEVISVNMMTDDCTFELKLIFPITSTEIDYSIVGEFMGFKLNSSGHGIGYRNNLEVTMRFKGKYTLIAGQTHIIFDEVKSITNFKGPGYVFMKDIVRGNLEETYKVNKAFNAKIKEFYGAWEVVLHEIVITLENIVKKVFASYALKELFVL